MVAVRTKGSFRTQRQTLKCIPRLNLKRIQIRRPNPIDPGLFASKE
jgi:hypothetical protein